ncbi:MAG: GIY-YIG nuclease family protein [Candidatus Paracaedibacter sp.]
MKRSVTKAGFVVYFVYSLQSENTPDRYYIGLTTDLMRRLEEHNAGKSIHTNKLKPWKLTISVAFQDEAKAEKFEKYLKTSSGRAFCKKHF